MESTTEPVPVPTMEGKSQADASEHPVTLPTTPSLSQLFTLLPEITKEAGYSEMWGVSLTPSSTDIPTSIVLEKFLRANTKNVELAKKQLIEALKWRKNMKPLQLVDEEFDTKKFGGLGYVGVYETAAQAKVSKPGGGTKKEIITWNIYGNVKSNAETFGDVDAFIKWRTALMELSVKELAIATATIPIPPEGEDQYRMVQVHDYLNVSFLRMDPAVKVASKEVIRVFSMAYPELLREKFFVNVPVLMGWVFAGMKLFLSPETIRKFHPLSYGSALAGELGGDIGKELPKAYGGEGDGVESGLTVKYATESISATEEEAKK